MKTINLTQGKVAIVSDEDFLKVSAFRWHALNIHGRFYAGRTEYKNGKKKNILMHKFIVGADGFIDHKDGNGLNNTRDNLRPCSHIENMRNTVLRRDSSSGFKGVTENKKMSSWTSHIRVNGTRKYLGNYASPIEAALVYNRAARELFGEFARQNIIPAHMVNVEPIRLNWKTPGRH